MAKQTNGNKEDLATLHERLFEKPEWRIAIKAGITASVSLVVGSSFAGIFNRADYLLSGSWAVLSALVVLQAHLGGTYRAAWVRFLGVLIGSFMGGLFTSIFGSNALALGTSVVLTVLICSALQLQESIRIACLSLSIVMILWGLHPSMNPWVFGLYRFFDSTIGIFIAVAVAQFIWPAQAVVKMRMDLSKTVRYVSRLFQMQLSLGEQPKDSDAVKKKLLADIRQLIKALRLYLKESELELLTKSKSIDEWEALIDHLEAIFESTIKLSSFKRYDLQKILDEDLDRSLAETMNATVEAFKELGEMLKQSLIKEDLVNLPLAISHLNQELTRFRATLATRKFEREDTEHFFVFFYNLRSIIEKIVKMQEKINKLNSIPK